jgi:hypothetical protein
MLTFALWACLPAAIGSVVLQFGIPVDIPSFFGVIMIAALPGTLVLERLGFPWGDYTWSAYYPLVLLLINAMVYGPLGAAIGYKVHTTKTSRNQARDRKTRGACGYDLRGTTDARGPCSECGTQRPCAGGVMYRRMLTFALWACLPAVIGSVVWLFSELVDLPRYLEYLIYDVIMKPIMPGFIVAWVCIWGDNHWPVYAPLVVFLINAMVYGSLGAAIGWWVHMTKTSRNQARDRKTCGACGYDLRGTTDARGPCPECGTQRPCAGGVAG